MAREQRVEAVERALSILEAFNQQRERMGLAELADETGLYKSTILRLAASLQRYGYLLRGSDGLYRLGPSLWRLGSLYRRGFDLGEVVRPALRQLVAATGETASFYVREGDERVCLYRENSPRVVRHHLDEGARLPLDRGAAAHVLREFTRDAPPRPVVSVGERNPELAAVAAAVTGADGALRGALAVSGPVARFDEGARGRAAALLAGIAAELSARVA
ncbi:MAG: helix-turn-helix domain-containing protein [Alphaproteobacteria bacterium]